MTLIPEGRYRAFAVPVTTMNGDTWCQIGESKNGKPQAVVNFEILDGEEAGRRIAWFGYFTEKTAARTVEALRYCGFTGDDLAAATVQPLEQEVEIVVNHETYEGKTSAKVQWVNRAGGGGFKLEKPMDRNGLNRFAAQMKNAVRQVPESPGAKAERGAKPAAPPAGDQGEPSPSGGWGGSTAGAPIKDDDIPF